MSRERVGVLLVGLLLWLVGCDDRSQVPAELLKKDQEAETQPAPRPTTQELTESPHDFMVLDTLPLRMKVPPKWKITRHGTSIVWLEGPTPHSDARIALKQRESIPPGQYEAFLTGTRRDQQEEKDVIIDIRSAGAMTIVDRRSFLTPVRSPEVDGMGIAKLDAQGQIVMQTTVPMRWWVHCFVPFDDRVDQYELNFVLITREQYEQDKPFLEKILSTLQYIGPQPATLPSTLPTTSPAAPVDGGLNR